MTCLRWCWVMLAALAAVAASPGHAQSRSRSAPCGCYCNIWLPAPCSDAACKAACGYREPGSGAISSPQPGSGAFTPQPDFEAERRAQDESRRKQEEDARLDADRRKAEQDRKFAEERDAAAKSLKGAEPPSGAGNALGLKGVTPSSGALRDLPRVEPVPSPSALLRREELDRLIARDAERYAASALPGAPRISPSGSGWRHKPRRSLKVRSSTPLQASLLTRRAAGCSIPSRALMLRRRRAWPPGCAPAASSPNPPP